MEEGGVGLGDLQGEILMEIFHKLPFKSVVGCKLVSKGWRCLISDRFFTSNYNPSSIPNHPTSLMIIPGFRYYSSRDDGVNAFTYDIKSTGHDKSATVPHIVPCNFLESVRGRVATVLGCWNGLVGLYDNGRGFCLLNPWTREEKLVLLAHELGSSGLGFELSGLCHDPVRDEYKAVLSRSTSFYVVSFKDGNCKSKTQHHLLRDLDRLYRPTRGSCRVIVKGVPHWICLLGDEESIVYFDQLMEEFRTVQLPEAEAFVGKFRATAGLGALGGQLTVAFRVQTVGVLEVWASKDNSWSKLFVILHHYLSFLVSLSSWLADDEVLINQDEEKFIVYNVRNRSFQRLAWLQRTNWYERRYGGGVRVVPHKLVTFMPTLVSPNR